MQITRQDYHNALDRGWQGRGWVDGIRFAGRDTELQLCALGALMLGFSQGNNLGHPLAGDRALMQLPVELNSIAMASNNAGSKERALAAVHKLIDRQWPEGKTYDVEGLYVPPAPTLPDSLTDLLETTIPVSLLADA